MQKNIVFSVLLASIASLPQANAGWSDYLDKLKGSVTAPGATTSAAGLTENEIVAGLKEALEEGTRFAVDSLGKDGGFLNNSQVRIPMPDSLKWVDKSLRTLGQEELADEFVASMNHAAEQAVPEAAAIFGDAIKSMSLEDAKSVLKGPDDAATRYFRQTTEAALTEKIRPVVVQSTEKAGVTSTYKKMMSKAGGLTSFMSRDVTDMDGYVTQKTLDGLFLMIAEEERKIRENPVARSSDLLKKVFGTYTQ
ncbi:uncharacterized protein DUF4197 [Thiogranum longum]|uniref:Uncharacterized protein DUF4197 n=1 Tax=Thiogranum longum TaxID=1537524 RepID=A0A4R1HG00_9GAMM|nr:DUF4197 domain-containing protein [Thiogranum longum]TCK18229.1 uncharacterized protein DUF4197 [Thiogranum longum]